jgi:hypothetical protein
MHATAAVNPVTEQARGTLIPRFSRICTSPFRVGSSQTIKIHHSDPSLDRSTKLSDNSSDTARCSRSCVCVCVDISFHHNVLQRKIKTLNKTLKHSLFGRVGNYSRIFTLRRVGGWEPNPRVKRMCIQDRPKRLIPVIA